jgi:hypothetical protein
MSTSMKTGLTVLSLALLLIPGCNKTPTTPTTTAPTPYSDSRVFSGILSVQATDFQSFTVSTSATVNVLLGSLTISGTSTTVSLPLRLSLGSPTSDGTACTASTTVTVSPALTSQINQSLIAGTYCVAISDAGSLTSDLVFAIRINQTANTTAPGHAGTETFSSNLYPLGAAVRTFAASQSGNVTVALSNVTPAASVGIGLGVSDGSNCFLNTAVVTTPGAGTQLSASADAATYCVKMFDTGQLSGRVLFDVTITHP